MRQKTGRLLPAKAAFYCVIPAIKLIAASQAGCKMAIIQNDGKAILLLCAENLLQMSINQTPNNPYEHKHLHDQENQCHAERRTLA